MHQLCLYVQNITYSAHECIEALAMLIAVEEQLPHIALHVIATCCMWRLLQYDVTNDLLRHVFVHD